MSARPFVVALVLLVAMLLLGALVTVCVRAAGTSDAKWIGLALFAAWPALRLIGKRRAETDGD